MPYISNAKIDYNFISPSFQYTQLQHFCLQIPQQRAGYSTSFLCLQTFGWAERMVVRGPPCSSAHANSRSMKNKTIKEKKSNLPL